MGISSYVKYKSEIIQVIGVVVFILIFLSFAMGGESEEERIEKMRLEENVRDEILMNLNQYDDFHFQMEEEIQLMYEMNELEWYLGSVLDKDIAIVEE